MELRIVSYNMLKGRSLVLGRHVQEEMAQALWKLEPDILVLQEFPDLSLVSQEEEASLNIFSTQELKYHAYGFNAKTRKGRHGNAVISRYPIESSNNLDISETRMAKRGLLSCRIMVGEKKLQLYSTHLDLFQKARNRQLENLARIMSEGSTSEIPLIFCGDFNDWNRKLDKEIRRVFGDHELNFQKTPRPVNTYPATLPILPLDRIYIHGMQVRKLWSPRRDVWKRLSDHKPLIADLSL